METFHHLHHANHWALLASTAFLWFLGAAWYSPALFVKPWMRALNVVLVPGAAKPGLVVGMVSSLVMDLVLSFILWHVVTWSGATTWETGALVGFLCWAGFVAGPQLPQGIYERRPISLFAINSGYWLVGLAVSGGLLAVWR